MTRVGGEALREAKRVLAFESTVLTHGEAAATQAEETTRGLFARDGNLSAELLAATVPTVEISASDIGETFTIAEAFVRAGLVSSRGEARRLATQGGLVVDDVRVENVDLTFAVSGNAALLRVGKKRYMRLVIAP